MEETTLIYSPDVARQRYESQQLRLIRLQAEKIEKMRLQKEKMHAKMAALRNKNNR